jgi:hypothetical protein
MGPLDLLGLIDIAKKFSDVGQADKENAAMEEYSKRKFGADETNRGREDNAARRQALLNIMGYNTQIKPNRVTEPRLPYEAFKKSKFNQMLGVASEAGNAMKKKTAQVLPMMMGIPSPGIGMDSLGVTDLASAFA